MLDSYISTFGNEVNNVETAVGLNTSGNFISYSGTNYLDSTSNIASAIEELDTQLFTSSGTLQSQIDSNSSLLVHTPGR